MKKSFLVLLAVFYSVSSNAQTDNIEIKHPVTSIGGTVVETSFNSRKNMLNVSIRNNDDEVEILAVRRGMVVDRESTFFMNDEMQLDLSNNVTGKYDIYVKARNEIQHIGSIETEIKEESK